MGMGTSWVPGDVLLCGFGDPEPTCNLCLDFLNPLSVTGSRQMLFGHAKARLGQAPTVCRTVSVYVEGVCVGGVGINSPCVRLYDIHS